jgi:(2Fe-2S) ferredoxin/predicted O-methyltransferase YrrM
MQPFHHHVNVCTQQKPDNVPACAASGAGAVVNAFYAEVGKQGLADDVIISTTGCLGGCEHGPVVVVYPEALWYGKVTPADVPEIVRSHLGQGQPVERLLLTDMATLRNEILDHRKKFYAMMQARAAAGVVPEELYELTRGFQASRMALTAIELDLFTAIGQGARADQLAAQLRTDPRATEMLLNALVGLKLLEKREGVFTNSAMTARFLVEGSSDNARPALLHIAHLWPRWSTLTECVREGTAVHPRDSSDQWTKSFISAMDRNARETAALVVRSVPGNGARRMLDLGGGSAAYSIAFAKTNPDLRVDLLDLPNVVSLAQEYVRKAGLQERICARGGDLRTDRLGQNYDLVLLSSICHMFTPEQNRDLLRRIFEALAPKGRLVIREFILEADKTAPRQAALFSLNMLVATDGGASYSEPEYEQWLRDAGFGEVKHIRLPGPAGLMIGTRT